MKKMLIRSLIAISALACGTIFASAQTKGDRDHEDHASWFVGGVGAYWYDTELKSHAFNLHPEVGYFLNDTWAVGLIAGYGVETSPSAGKSTQWVKQELSISPFVRYYYLHRGPFNLYLDGNVGYSYESTNADVHHGFEAGLRPGACLDLTEGICLCLRMGFLGYRKSFHGEEPGLSANGFGLSFTPEELMVGIELEF